VSFPCLHRKHRPPHSQTADCQLPLVACRYTAAAVLGALQSVVGALAGLYVGGIAGFMDGATHSALGSLHALSGGVGAVARVASAALQGVLRWLFCWV